MVIAVITGCHYSTTISNICGRKPVQLFATLFLLFYAKIIRVVITVFLYTVLVYPDGFHKKVWLYDGTVEFLRGKYAILFVFFFFSYLSFTFSSIYTHINIHPMVSTVFPLPSLVMGTQVS